MTAVIINVSSLAILVIITSFKVSEAELHHNVSLRWHDADKTLSLDCVIHKQGFGVFIYDPKGKTRGHCGTPILPENVTGTCDPGMKQKILPGENVKNTLVIQLHKCENGIWKCVHGQKRNEEDTIQVIMDLDVTCPFIQKQFRITLEQFTCSLMPMTVGYVIGYILYRLVELCRKSKKDFWKYKFGKEIICWRLFLIKFIVLLLSIVAALPLSLYHRLCKDVIPSLCVASAWFIVAVIEMYLLEKVSSMLQRSSTKDEEQSPSESMLPETGM